MLLSNGGACQTTETTKQVPNPPPADKSHQDVTSVWNSNCSLTLEETCQKLRPDRLPVTSPKGVMSCWKKVWLLCWSYLKEKTFDQPNLWAAGLYSMNEREIIFVCFWTLGMFSIPLDPQRNAKQPSCSSSLQMWIKSFLQRKMEMQRSHVFPIIDATVSSLATTRTT